MRFGSEDRGILFLRIGSQREQKHPVFWRNPAYLVEEGQGSGTVWKVKWELSDTILSGTRSSHPTQPHEVRISSFTVPVRNQKLRG